MEFSYLRVKMKLMHVHIFFNLMPRKPKGKYSRFRRTLGFSDVKNQILHNYNVVKN